MTALRPERESASPYGEPYGDADAFEAAVGRMDDPLNDPLPEQGHGPGYESGAPAPDSRQASAQSAAQETYGGPGAYEAYGAREPYRTGEPYDAEAYGGHEGYESSGGYGSQGGYEAYESREAGRNGEAYEGAYEPAYESRRSPSREQVEAIRQAARQAVQEASRQAAASPQTDAGATALLPTVSDPAAADPAVDGPPGGLPPIDDETVALRVPATVGSGDPGIPPGGGRAARRKAAKGKRGGRRARGRRPANAPAAAGADSPAPTSRLEARRLARARKDPPGVVASRVVGELFITIGVLMLLFVTYQLWYTNVLAHAQAGGAANNLQKAWDQDGAEDDRRAGAFAPGQGFAIMYIPKLDVKVPIAEGIDKHKVLDRGMVGHYADGKLKTGMPWDKKGNFAVAGHRNTHGEPFRYINRLDPGDEIIVETRNTFYTYEMASILPQTSPANIGVIRPVPPGSGFTGPGRYITLTTCTPEFTSTYRMIVWGKMVDERPRSKGKPDALVG
ncbi:class E sortase [Streptomyces sp. 8N616]|uniref:class E sortase n=1 Tax=Streptomyces sp. 8N616 TaxID=3457414 RepID=UPI003FD56A29